MKFPLNSLNPLFVNPSYPWFQSWNTYIWWHSKFRGDNNRNILLQRLLLYVTQLFITKSFK